MKNVIIKTLKMNRKLFGYSTKKNNVNCHRISFTELF